MITNGAQIEPGLKGVERGLFFGVMGAEMRTRRNWFILAVAAVCLVTAVALSYLIEPGVHVEKVTLAEDTPALKFSPTGAGPHPVALLAHGYASSKEALFRYGEALAAAGFICYSVDQPGHGASRRTYTLMAAAHALEAVAREVGPVDVFAGWSMGGFTGGEAVREGGMRPGLFIAIGSMPVLGDQAPPLLFLAGRFEEALPPALLKTRTDARLVISPWSDHLLEGFDPVLVNAAVDAACAQIHKMPPAPPRAWHWRLTGVALAMLAAAGLASCLTNLFPQLARFRGLFIGVFIVIAFMLTIGGRWLEAIPHLRLQVIAMPVILLLAIMAGRLRIPRWGFAALSVLVTVIAVCWFKSSLSRPALILMASTLVLTPALIAGIVIGWFAARRGSRLQGDVAMAIFLGCAPFQCLELPRTAPQSPPSHTAIKLDAKLLDACVGEYRFPPDNGFWLEWKMTILRQGNQLVEQVTTQNKSYAAVDIYPESETNFFVTANRPHELTFVNNDQGEVTAVIERSPEGPVREGKKLKRK
ncbi:MAG TPA: alpha/beta fold hydrolase [Verrucomicrobiae bacterium]|nr:alpha/beta fold hydrolase [Verrucomicrobiae bacterium]